MRGPAEARASRGGEPEGEDLPPGVKSADFKTLQNLIEKGIKDAESGNANLEGDLHARSDDEHDLQRHKELMRRRREEDEQAKQREKEVAREKRRREDELRRKKMEEEMEREELQVQREREEKAGREALCLRQFRAAVQIQAQFRGRRSRTGKHITSPVVVATKHTLPWVSKAMASQPITLE